MICDFCSCEPITTTVLATSFELPPIGNIHQASLGNWAACDQCAELIRADCWANLSIRVSDLMDCGDTHAYFDALYALLRTHIYGIEPGIQH